MKIGIDIDDTITDTYDRVLEFAAKELDVELEELKAQKLNYDELYRGTLYRPMMDDIFENFKYIIPNIEPKPDAIEYMQKLIDEGHELILITARAHTNPGQNEEFVKEKGIPYTKLYEKIKDKKQVCEEEGIRIFIDDSIDNCKLVKSKKTRVLLFDAEYNKRDRELHRVKTWKEVYDVVQKTLSYENNNQ